MDFKLDMFDQEAKTIDEVNGTASPLVRREKVVERHEFIRKCASCKSETIHETWHEAFKHEPETIEEKAAVLLKVCERTYHREERLKGLETMTMAYALLATSSSDLDSGKSSFDNMETSTQETFIKMAAKAIALCNNVYYNREKEKDGAK